MAIEVDHEVCEFFQDIQVGEIISVSVDADGYVIRTNGTIWYLGDLPVASSDHHNYVLWVRIMDKVVSPLLTLFAGMALVYKRACTINRETLDLLTEERDEIQGFEVPFYAHDLELNDDQISEIEDQQGRVAYFEFEVVRV